MEMIARNGVPAHFIRYEDMVRDRATTLRLFSCLIGVDIKAESSKPSTTILTKVRDDWNTVVETRFRKDEADFVRKLDGRRLVKASS